MGFSLWDELFKCSAIEQCIINLNIKYLPGRSTQGKIKYKININPNLHYFS